MPRHFWGDDDATAVCTDMPQNTKLKHPFHHASVDAIDISIDPPTSYSFPGLIFVTWRVVPLQIGCKKKGNRLQMGQSPLGLKFPGLSTFCF